MKPVSLLLISDTYPPVMGGSEVEAQRVASAMIRRGHRVQVLCAGGSPMPAVRDWMDPAGVPVRILTRRSRGRLKDIVFALGVVWTLWRDRHRYDAVYFLMQGLHLAGGLPMARLLGKPMVMKFSGSGIIPVMRHSRVGRLELSLLTHCAGRIMVLNEAMVEEAVAAGLPRQLLTWMPNPVDTDEFRPAQGTEAIEWRNHHGIPPSATVVTYVGRLSPEKGLTQLLRAFARISVSAPELMLLLIGDGVQRTELEAVANELRLGPTQIRFIGRVDLSEVPSWLRSSDVFALLSPNEGFSCALLEAMATGLASIVSDIAANRQLIENQQHGLTAPFGNEAAAGEALLQLFRNPSMRQRMGAAARTRALENYSTARVLERYESLLSELLN